MHQGPQMYFSNCDFICTRVCKYTYQTAILYAPGSANVLIKLRFYMHQGPQMYLSNCDFIYTRVRKCTYQTAILYAPGSANVLIKLRFYMHQGPQMYLSNCDFIWTRDELHKANVTERFVALRYATVRYQKAFRGAS